MLDVNTRLQAILAAPAKVLARIDMILSGEDTTTATRPDADCRTTTFTDAARRLRVSRPTVYRLVKAGRLRTIRLTGVNRVVLASVEQLANAAASE